MPFCKMCLTVTLFYVAVTALEALVQEIIVSRTVVVLVVVAAEVEVPPLLTRLPCHLDTHNSTQLDTGEPTVAAMVVRATLPIGGATDKKSILITCTVTTSYVLLLYVAYIDNKR